MGRACCGDAHDVQRALDRVRNRACRHAPKGVQGISRVCVTIESTIDYARLRNLLIAQKPVPIPGSSVRAYGTITVK
ncbi:hypothetical protein DIE04_08975 [Burkholderia sp. Bp8994]|nr:hypothetical protein DIE20_28905 [Burkholderia sp. Bp9131]RQR62845.1 hypothetical protein DIE12_34715 [Burkholderia sp. Bp9015]RQR98779.1 hypothetical protein DIE04_08975 [Burkholderia sp. Bp8994]RQS25143.1 hypothetical protein DIE05_24745 [Burkholderia sp. Bp8995]RQS42617.1 hypothetical protein DIE01_09320 [Burkholderia sp. Bp8990]RQS43705.1 hypothetical protein DIE00_23350 [Burkholderia sp. Bp8989]RQZ50542.1 hypothetical protein DIE17_05935 [Burkholderia sp. Bp9099]